MTNRDKKRKVAIIGRPNVGKSTFFNRLTKSRAAIVDNLPGITRDRQHGTVSWESSQFTLIDTGGFISTDEDGFKDEIHYQVDIAIREADVVLVIFDGRAGVSPFDKDIILLLKNFKNPIFYLVNKIDGSRHISLLYDFYELGIEKLYPVSAEHNFGISDVIEDVVKELPKYDKGEEEEELIKVGVVGRPNVGKSSFINRILGKNRLVVSDIAGTTRDSIDTICKVEGKKYILIDTAGIRRKGKTKDKIEKFSVIKALNTLDRCDVALIFIDAEEGVTEQDITISGYAFKKECASIFVFNKWDAAEDKNVKKYYEKLYYEAKYLTFAPAITVSALTGQRVFKVFDIVEKVYKDYTYRIETGKLNRIIEEAILKTPPSMHQGKRLKFYYTTQVKTKPPTFISFVNYPKAVHFSYKRYLINRIREKTGLKLTLINLIFKLRTGKIDFGKLKGKRNRKTKRV